jgi:translation initiation factor 2B subunit (eIF-2B alpha/beta/delta family)
MVVGNTMVYDELFKSMVDRKADFTVIVVDSSPKFESRSLL